MNLYTYTPTKLPPIDQPFRTDERLILTPELPFWWFLNPWKTCEDLQLSLFRAVDVHRKDSAERDEATEQVRDKVHLLEIQIDTLKAERDAANEAVRTLRKKGRRK